MVTVHEKVILKDQCYTNQMDNGSSLVLQALVILNITLRRIDHQMSLREYQLTNRG